MKFYVCVLEVEAYDKGSVFGKSFLPGDFQICSLVVSADNFLNAIEEIKEKCCVLDFCDCTIISLGRIFHE